MNQLVQQSIFFNPEAFEQAQRVAKVFAQSTLIPEHFRGNLGNCLIAFDFAVRINMTPLLVMQNMYIIKGKPALEAKFIIAMLNQSEKIKGRLTWEFDNEEKPMQCTCIAETENGSYQETLTWREVEKMGWDKLAAGNWLRMTKKMFQYRTASMLARTYFPDLIFGLHSVEELQESAIEAQTEVFHEISIDELDEKIKEKIAQVKDAVNPPTLADSHMIAKLDLSKKK
jgi:hypothetical protein